MNFNIFKPISAVPIINKIDFEVFPDSGDKSCECEPGRNGASITIVDVTKVGLETTILFSDGSSVVITDGVAGTDGEDGEDGIDGTDGTDGTDGSDGSDGISISSATIDTNPVSVTYKHLLLTLSDGSTLDAGVVVGLDGIDGDDGLDGDDGISITNVELNSDNELIITLSDSSEINAGRLSFYVDANSVTGDAASTDTLAVTLSRSSGKIVITNARANTEDYFTITLTNSKITTESMLSIGIVNPTFSASSVYVESYSALLGSAIIKLFNYSSTDTFSGDFEIRFAIL